MATYQWDTEHLAEELWKLEQKLNDCADNVAKLEDWMQQAKDRMALATSMIADASVCLAGPPRAGITSGARADLKKAQEMLEENTAALPKLQAQLGRWRAALVLYTDMRKQFPMAELKKQRKRDNLQSDFYQAAKPGQGPGGGGGF